MKVKYDLDKEKFVKVYNELYCGNTKTIIDRFGLFYNMTEQQWFNLLYDAIGGVE